MHTVTVFLIKRKLFVSISKCDLLPPTYSKTKTINLECKGTSLNFAKVNT